MTTGSNNVYYSPKYFDDEFEYRHVIMPKELIPLVPKGRLLSEAEWRGIGVEQSPGWVHYMLHNPEPHILLFRRPVPKS
ncbi:cyclin-dependent kinases regulatory subunit-like [Sycon ciliatum]|uniref:cyclin-dependent kinases regulatory subunit-like n=1 Tax=Sycon ciliatum TaxID=27933 RepID=UPI0020AD6B9A